MPIPGEVKRVAAKVLKGRQAFCPTVQTRAPAVASRLFESIFSRYLGLASQASTCHRFAVKEELRKTISKGQKLAQMEIDHNSDFRLYRRISG